MLKTNHTLLRCDFAQAGKWLEKYCKKVVEYIDEDRLVMSLLRRKVPPPHHSLSNVAMLCSWGVKADTAPSISEYICG